MKKLYALLLGLALSTTGYGQIQIVGYMANPASTDSPYEYVLLRAIRPIDFAATPYSVVVLNNGAATSNGWVAGGAVTYGFNLSTGSVVANETFYVGGTGKTINGAGSTALTGKFIREINTGTTVGDGFGNANTTGVIGNGGANADGIGVFSGLTSSLTNATAPIDAVFFGTAVGSAKPASGGYVLPVNDRYPGGIFGTDASTSYLFPNTATEGTYFLLSGSPRTATAVANPTQESQLPVTYLNFQATYTPEKMVAVSWATVAETDNAHFEVERSADAASYVSLGRVIGKGTTTVRQTYTFTDEAPAAGWNYYRLRQVDRDGTASLSRPVAVLNENALDNTLTLMPNPASTIIRLALASGQVPQHVSVVGLSGQRTVLPVSDEGKLNVTELPAALYLIEVQTTTGRVLRQRLLKQ